MLTGNAAPFNAADHVTLLELALAQLPVTSDGEDPEGGVAMLVRTDSAGASHAFVEALRERGIVFSLGFRVSEDVRLAISDLPASAWMEAMDADMEPRDEAQVAELTEGVDLSAWPPGTRMILRRELPHPGATFNLFDPNGYRHQVFICDSADPDIAYLEARHRGHARVEDRIRCAKDTGLRNLPFPAFENNACWVELVLMAQDLIAFTQGLVSSTVARRRLESTAQILDGPIRITVGSEGPPRFGSARPLHPLRTIGTAGTR